MRRTTAFSLTGPAACGPGLVGPLLALLLAASGCGGSGGTAVDGPALAARSVEVDFGDLWEGEKRRHTFELESVGTEPFRVVERANSCGCSEIAWFEADAAGERAPYTAGEPIEPGHRLIVEVEFDSSGRVGHFDDALRLYSPHPSAPRIPLAIRAHIRPLLAVESVEGGLEGVAGTLSVAAHRQAGNALAEQGRFVDLGLVQLGDPSAGAVAILASNAGPLALRVGEEGRPPGLAVALEPQDADAQGRAERWRLAVTVADGAQAGTQLGTVALVSDRLGADGEPLVCRVHVQAVVRGLVEFVGGRVGFGVLDAGGSALRSVPVVTTDPAVELPDAPAIEIAALLAGPHGDEEVSDWFRATWIVEDGRNRLDLELLPLPEGRFGTFEGVVRVDLGLALQPELEVPFVGTATGLRAPGPRLVGPELPTPGSAASGTGAADEEG